MGTLVAFAQGLLNFALEFLRLIVNLFIYIFSFIVALLQQLLGATL